MATQSLVSGFDAARAETEAFGAVLALADGLARLLATTLARAHAGRAVELDGLDRMIGLVCARALNLPPHHGRSLRPRLIDLLAELDRIRAASGAGSLH